MRCTDRRAWLSLLLVVACAREQPEATSKKADQVAAPAPATLPGVTLDTALVRRLGIRTVALDRATRVAELAAPGEIVPDPGAVTVVRASVPGRLVAGDAAWPRLGERVVAGQVVGQVGDALPLVAPEHGTVSRVGARPGELVQPGQELLEIRDYTRALVRVVWPEGIVPSGPVRVRWGKRWWTARPAGTAAEADPLTRMPASLYRLEDPGATLRPGTAVTVYAPDPAGGRGLLVPEAAAVQWDGLVWAYVERSPGRFVRVRLPTDRPVAEGWLVSPGDFDPGDRVVTAGAGQLLSEEFRTRIVVGEEVGE